MKKLILTLILSPLFAFAGEYCQNPPPGGYFLPICEDQVGLVNEALEAAKAENKILVVMFGATWCGWTRSFHLAMQAENAVPEGVRYLEIGINTALHGQRHRVESGAAALVTLLAAANVEASEAENTVKSFPTILAVNPNSKKYLRLVNDQMVDENGYNTEKIKAQLTLQLQPIR